MTPPTLDVDACLQKLALLEDLLADLDRQGSPSGDELRADRDRRHVVERILTQLVDISVGLNGLLCRGLGHRRSTRRSIGRTAAGLVVTKRVQGDRPIQSCDVRNSPGQTGAPLVLRCPGRRRNAPGVRH